MNNQDFKILIIDDDDIFRELLSSFFEDEKFQVDVADNGLKGLEVFGSFKPDIILTDVIMPKLNGIEMAKKIISEGHKTPIIFLSGHTFNKDVEDIKKSDCWGGIFSKPFDENELLEFIKNKLHSLKK